METPIKGRRIQEFSSVSSCYERIKDFDFIVVITGWGSSGMYDDVDNLFAEDSMLSKLANQISEKHANWVVVFGGDKYVEDKPDVAHVSRFLPI